MSVDAAQIDNAPLHICSCGASYTAAAWSSLPSAGVQRIPETEDGPAYELDLKNCTACGSTRSRLVQPQLVTRDQQRVILRAVAELTLARAEVERSRLMLGDVGGTLRHRTTLALVRDDIDRVRNKLRAIVEEAANAPR